ncbi:ankyrin repeat domain-containing protein [candidate division KSB1 bacterium]
MFFKKHIILIMVLSLCFSSLFSQSLQDAAKNGKLDEVKKLLMNDPDLLNNRDRMNKTALHIACENGHTELVKFLVEKGANVNITDYDFKKPLLWAAEKGHREILDILLNNNADKSATDINGKSAVHLAVENGFTDLVEWLLSNGFDLNSRALHDVTLLHSAAMSGQNNMVRRLIEKGLNVDVKNVYGKTPLHYAASYGKNETVELLLKLGANINVKAVNGKTAYHLALEGKQQETAEILKENGADTTPWEFSGPEGDYLGQDPPGTVPEIFAPGIVSTDGFEFAITFTPDGNEFYFTRRNGEKHLPTNTIIYSRRKNGKWIEPEIAPFSGKYFDFEPHISPDGKKLYFGTMRPVKEGEQPQGMRQWCFERAGSEWTNLKPLGPPFDNIHAMYVTTADNGNIYFTGQGITVSRFENGKYQEPERLGKRINFIQYTAHPFIAPDESYIIYDGQPDSPFDFKDYFYISFKQKNGSWSDVVNLSEKCNLGTGLMCASISPDGKYLFYSQGGNIYWVSAKIIDELKPEELK